MARTRFPRPMLARPGRIAIALAAAAAAAVLAGCDTYDPQLREGMWHPTHPNRTNIALMAANPADLVRGHGVQGSDGILDAAAVDRLMTNKVKKLPEAGLSDIQVRSQGSAE